MRKIVIMGGGGRDFHNFNVAFRDDRDTSVLAFTAAQIPDAVRATPRAPRGVSVGHQYLG
jgi:predicted GTPase